MSLFLFLRRFEKRWRNPQGPSPESKGDGGSCHWCGGQGGTSWGILPQGGATNLRIVGGEAQSLWGVMWTKEGRRLKEQRLGCLDGSVF